MHHSTLPIIAVALYYVDILDISQLDKVISKQLTWQFKIAQTET